VVDHLVVAHLVVAVGTSNKPSDGFDKPKDLNTHLIIKK